MWISVLILISIYLMFLILSPIKIGIILSVNTTNGYEENLALQFWRSKFPRIGLKRVVFLIETPPLSREKFEEVYSKLVEKNVSIIIGGSVSAEGIILSELADKYKIPTFGITTGSVLLKGKKDNYYRFLNSTSMNAYHASIYLHESGIRRLLIVASKFNREYTQTYANFLKKYMEYSEIVFLEEMKVMEKLKSFKPDAVFMIVPAVQVSILGRMIRKFDRNIKLFSSGWGRTMVSRDLWDPSLEGLEYITNDTPNPVKFADLMDEFQQLYNIQPGIGTGYAFSTIAAIYDAIRKVGRRREKLIDYFNTPRIYDTAYGKVFMNEFGDAVSDFLYTLRVEKGEIIEVGRLLIDEFYERKP